MGGRGEWVMGHGFGLGLGGYGFINDATYNPADQLNYVSGRWIWGTDDGTDPLRMVPGAPVLPHHDRSRRSSLQYLTGNWNDPYEY